MCAVISKYFLSKRIWIRRRDFSTISLMIVKDFPREIQELYYEKPNEKSNNPKGYLYHSYMNRVKEYKDKKILNRVNKKRTIPPNENVEGIMIKLNKI